LVVACRKKNVEKCDKNQTSSGVTHKKGSERFHNLEKHSTTLAHKSNSGEIKVGFLGDSIAYVGMAWGMNH
jgi:hypothetical protein